MKKLLSGATLLAFVAGLAAPASSTSLRTMPAANLTLPYRHAPAAPAKGTYGPTEFIKHLGARYLGPSKIANMTIDVATPMRNPEGLKSYARAASTPGSHYYRQWLTPAQIADSFGTPAATYASAVKYFQGLGLFVHVWPTRNVVTITGNGPKLERALGTTFGRFALHNGSGRGEQVFDAPMTAPALAKTFPGLSISHLVNVQTKRTHFMITSPPQPISAGFSNARVNGATPTQLARAYDYTGAYEAGYTGKNINIGIIGTGPISPKDVPNMRKIYNTPGTSTVKIVPTSVVSGDSTPPPVTGPCPSTVLGGISPIGDPTAGSSTSPSAGCNPEDIEAQLDTEQTSLLAYDANVLFYLAYNANGCAIEENPVTGGCIGPDATSQGLDLSDDELMQAVSDNKADILSLSYGGCEILNTALMGVNVTPGADATGTDPTIFEMLATEGVAVFVSSGDSGSAGCQRNIGNSDAPNVSYPSSDPNVVAVGGTTTPMGPDGRLTGPITTWGEQTESGGAEGAGTSIDFQTPSYQTGVLAACTMRCVPDVVLDADPFSGAAVVFNTGLTGGAMEEPVGGTSQAAPDMAAMWALVLSACKVTPKCTDTPGVTDPAGGKQATGPAYRLGNPNYLWYKLTAATQATAYHDTFYDIVYGNDGVPSYAAQEAAGLGAEGGVSASAYAAGVVPGDVSAGAGFDEATGLGAPFARSLIRYVVGI